MHSFNHQLTKTFNNYNKPIDGCTTKKLSTKSYQQKVINKKVINKKVINKKLSTKLLTKFSNATNSSPLTNRHLGWRASFEPATPLLSHYAFHICVSADGRRNTMTRGYLQPYALALHPVFSNWSDCKFRHEGLFLSLLYDFCV